MKKSYKIIDYFYTIITYLRVKETKMKKSYKIIDYFYTIITYLRVKETKTIMD